MISKIAEATGGSIRQVCSVLGLPRSSFYHAATPTPLQEADERMGCLIEAIFQRHRKRYGYRRIREELADRGEICAPARIRRIMAQRGLHAIQPKNYRPKTSDGRADKPSPNRLAGQPLPEVPNRVWAGDITFIPTNSGWMYLAVVIDLCSRRIVGWSLADNLRSDLVLAALRQALQTRPSRHVIFHSDRGSQYGSSTFRAALNKAGMLQSMSARANPYDNAWTESFIGTLKAEMLQNGCFPDASHARREIFQYIDGYYNTHRKHSSLGYCTPSQFESSSNQKTKTPLVQKSVAPHATSVRDLTTSDSTLCFSRCRFHGRAPSSNMWAGFTGSMPTKRKSLFTITRMMPCRCLPPCLGGA
jgi:putative transposase